MSAELPRPQVDERVISAGTTIRFALLAVLLLAASSAMMLSVIGGLMGRYDDNCLLAAGANPAAGTFQAILATQAQYVAYEACQARFQEPPPPWWVAVAWPVLLPVVASVLFFALPAWKARRGRVVPLDAIDQDGDLRRQLAGPVSVAGLAQAPRFVVDPAAASIGAVVFGRNRRPTVCLHGGLIARCRTDDESLRAVLLHELAHIRNGDVTITYATVAMWRVFLATVLLPYAVWSVWDVIRWLQSPSPTDVPPALTRPLLFTAVMVVLVYLARSDVLRSREIYADLAAVRWGADSRRWVSTTSGPPRGALRRAFSSFMELWRTHPRWDLRRNALTDPSTLFDIPVLPMFLTGAAATLIHDQLSSPLVQYGLSGWWDQAAGMISAGLVTGVAGIALWRATVYSMLTSQSAASWVRAGLGLGSGIVAGAFVTDRFAVFEWLPTHPEILLVGVLAGVVFAWWVTQCAQLWARQWRGPTIQLAMLLSLATAGLAFTWWFRWWQYEGAVRAIGPPISAEMGRQLLEQALSAPPGEHSAMLSAIAAAHPFLSGITDQPLAPTAVALLWLVPLLALTIRPSTAAPQWARAALRTGEASGPVGAPPPPLPRVLLPGLLGGVLGWAAMVIVPAYLHARLPTPVQLSSTYVLIYAVWLLLVLLVATGAASVAASMLVRHYRLLVALIAAETAALVGLGGIFVLLSLPGCTPPLNAFQISCRWDPGAALRFFQPFLALGVVLPGLIAVIAAAVVTVLRKVRPLPTRPSADAPPPGSRRRVPALHVAVATLCAAAVGITAGTEVHLTEASTPTQDTPEFRQLLRVVDDAAVSPRTRATQVASWLSVGGEELIHRFADDLRHVSDALIDVDGVPNDQHRISRVHTACSNISQFARDADSFFRVPEPEAQELWQTLTAHAAKGGADCVQALDENNDALFGAAVAEIEEAGNTGLLLGEQIGAVLNAGVREPD